MNMNIVYYFKVYVERLYTINCHRAEKYYTKWRLIGSLLLLRSLLVRVIEIRPQWFHVLRACPPQVPTTSCTDRLYNLD